MWPDANVGFRTGEGLVVLDGDSQNGGAASLGKLEAPHGTLVARTGRGGLHLYRRGHLPDRKALVPALDLKAGGGYVVAPLRLHASGRRYTWDTSGRRIAPARRWVAELAERSGSGNAPGPAREHVIPVGTRPTPLTFLAGTP